MIFDASDNGRIAKRAEELQASIDGYNKKLGETKTAREDNNRLLEASATPSSSPQQTGGDIIIPISIGDEAIETVVVNAVTRANAASGGWSV